MPSSHHHQVITSHRCTRHTSDALSKASDGVSFRPDDPDDWGQQQEKELKVDGPEKYQDEHATADATFISGMSRRDLHHLFKYGRPSNNLAEVGLTIHCFDGTEDYAAPWMPCHDERQLVGALPICPYGCYLYLRAS